jgi:hypothetical protein
MPILKMRFVTRRFVQEHRNWVFVFGDNMDESGYGGQAKSMRGEPNAIGIPTKWRPATDEAAYFCDADLPRIKQKLDFALSRVAAAVASGEIVVLPEDGVGTGRAQLQTRAPSIFRYIQAKLNFAEPDSQ